MQNTPPSGTPPEAPGGQGGSLGSTNITYSGATTFSESTSLSKTNSATLDYVSQTGGENAVLVTAGEVSLSGFGVTKSGDESSESSDFYGTNAGILATGGTLTLDEGQIGTNGSHANAVFAYGDGEIVVKNTEIKTSGNNSGAIMVTGGGTLTAENVTAETSGNSSAPIRSDRGGGVLVVSGGSFTSSGVGSPVIYSTASVSVSDAKLVSTASEGIVIEGSNSVSLNGVTLTDTNTSLNGNSETFKNIFIYQSMSGDAEEGIGTFSATESTITTNKGDTFFITNTTANISLENNVITNNDTTSAFLRAEAGKWGTAGSNGGHVTLALENQVAEGDIVLDNLSSLSMSLIQSSYYMGVINGENTASSVSVSLDSTSQLILAGDSYVSELKNSDSTNQNIFSNGYKLYISGTEVSINGSEAPEAPEVVLEPTETTTTLTEVTTVGATTDCEASSALAD